MAVAEAVIRPSPIDGVDCCELVCCGCGKVLSEGSDGVRVTRERPREQPWDRKKCRYCKTMNYVALVRR